MEDVAKLLSAYKQLWSNRSLEKEGVQDKERLIEAIKVELKDELTHPRVRKKPTEKYILAIQRVINSELEELDQLSLIKIFSRVLASIQEEEGKKRS